MFRRQSPHGALYVTWKDTWGEDMMTKGCSGNVVHVFWFLCGVAVHVPYGWLCVDSSCVWNHTAEEWGGGSSLCACLVWRVELGSDMQADTCEPGRRFCPSALCRRAAEGWWPSHVSWEAEQQRVAASGTVLWRWMKEYQEYLEYSIFFHCELRGQKN